MTNSYLGPDGWELGSADFATDQGGPASRVRVDPGQTGFYAGRMFRTYAEHVILANNSNPFYGRFTAAGDFILWAQGINLTQGAVRFQVFTGAAFAGAWTQRSVIGVNRMARRPKYNGAYYQAQNTFEVGGTFTGGTEVDLDLLRASASNASASSVGTGEEERGLPAGAYGIKATILDGGIVVNDPAQLLLKLRWEELP